MTRTRASGADNADQVADTLFGRQGRRCKKGRGAIADFDTVVSRSGLMLQAAEGTGSRRGGVLFLLFGNVTRHRALAANSSTIRPLRATRALPPIASHLQAYPQ